MGELLTLESGARLVHVASALLLVGGIVGRDLALGRAGRSTELPVVTALVGVAGRFEAFMVRPGSMLILAAGVAAMIAQGRPLIAPGGWWLTISIALFLTSIPLIAFVFLPRGRRFEAALAEAMTAGVPTPALAAAFADPVVAAARRFELAAISIVVYLMVVKPF